jgi:hypothetical protein
VYAELPPDLKVQRESLAARLREGGTTEETRPASPPMRGQRTTRR